MDEDFMEEDYLIHYGVLGMKWGVRKSKRSSSGASSRKTTKKSTSKISEKFSTAKKNRKAKKLEKAKAKKLKEQRKKPVKELTDSELKDRIARLELEKQYKNLNQQTVSRGSKVVDDIIWNSISNIGTQAVTYELGTLLNAVSKKVSGEEIVNPRKGQKDKK